ncbi:MAG: CotH kinase family protein [bacterium]
MRALISSATALLLCCLLSACPAANRTTEPGGQAAGNAVSDVPPVSGEARDIIREETLEIAIADPLESSGSTNFSPAGAMLLGGDTASSITYEIGQLRNGDQLEKLTLDLRPGRQPGADCRLRIASSGAELWQDFELRALDHPQELILVDRGIGGTNEGSFFLRLECAPGNGIAIRDITASMVLSSQQAQRIELDLPEHDIAGVDIRVPLRALDVDGRIDRSYGGIAELRILRGENVLMIPLAFTEGLIDASFNLSPAGDYDVLFTSELQDQLKSVLHIRECSLPVYELQVQQAQRSALDTLDLPAMETFGSIRTAGTERVRATISGLPLDIPDAPWRPLQLSFPDGLEDQGLGYTRRNAQLRRCGLDPLQLREPLAAWLAEGLELDHMRARAVHLRLNGCYQGVYIDAEVPDEAWLDSRGYAADSELYVVTGNAGLNPREEIIYFDELFRRVRQPQAGMQALSDRLVDAATLYVEQEDSERFSGMAAGFDNTALVNCFLLYSLCSAQENYRSDYAVLDPGAGGGWSVLPTDMSLSLGIVRSVNPVMLGADFRPINDMDMVGSIKDNIVLRTVLGSPEGQQLLFGRMQALLPGSLSAENTVAELDRLWQAVRPELLADPRMEFTAAQLDDQVEMLRGNVREHWEFILAQPDAAAASGGASGEHAGHDH